jgi:beta-xylosidase
MSATQMLLLVWLAIGQLVSAAEPRTTATNSPARTYRNPLLPDVEMADPDVIRVNGKYYLYATTDARGYQAFASDDLVHWELRGRAFVDPRGGDWAPEVLHYRGDQKFYLYYTDNATNGAPGLGRKQIGVAVASSPLGPFTDQGALAAPAIDADPFQDEDGKLYLYYVDLENGFKIVAQQLETPTTKKGSPTVLIRPTEPWEKISGAVTEGPFMVKHNGAYYLTYSGTGANSPNYGIGYATSKSPLGPFVKYPGNPIVHRGGNVLGPGHHCVIAAPDGKLCLIYHQKWNAETNFHRFLALDPIRFDEQGVIHATPTREMEQPVP